VQDGLYVALSSQVALEKRLNTIADNVANSSTVGFRATGVRFEDVVSGLDDKAVSFVSTGDTFLSTASGPLRETGNPFDFAIKGTAWFGMETPAGTVMTRDGRFTLTENGDLVTLEGHPVLDAGGAPIQLDPQNVGALGLFSFDPGANFVRYGNSGVVPAGEPEPLVDRLEAGVVQGFLEESNVNPMLEITRLVMVQRAFENGAALLRDTESSYDEAIKTLGSK
jgi:flagellar basal-body rod protein FlgF